MSRIDPTPVPLATRPERAERAPAPPPAPARPEPDATSVLSHYLELLRSNLKLCVGMTLAAGALAALVAFYQLTTQPVYRASAKVTVQPTDAELRFTQVYVRSSSYDSANVVTQSHMEYLRSREIAARTFQILQERYGTSEEVAPADEGTLKAALSGLKLWLRSTYKTLDSGVFVPVTGDDSVINDIRESIRLNMIESSFIMEIAVTWTDPQIAADIANILASVYQERANEQAAQATAELTGFLESRRNEVQGRIDALIGERNALRESFGIVDYDTERAELLRRVAAETERLDADRARLQAMQAKIDAFGDSTSDPRQRRESGLSQISVNELSLARLEIVELRQSIVEREAILAGLQEDVQRFSGFEMPFEEIQTALARERVRLDDVEERLLTVQMNQTEAIDALRLIDPARPPLYPSEPRAVKSTVIGAAAGFVLALTLILGRDLVTDRLQTRADLREASGARVLGPIRFGPARGGLARLFGRREAGPGDAPYLGWSALETSGTVLVLDQRSEDRAEQVALDMMCCPPFLDDVVCGVLRQARRPGFVPADVGAVLVTLARGETSAEDLREDMAALRRAAPGVPVAIAYIDDGAPGT